MKNLIYIQKSFLSLSCMKRLQLKQLNELKAKLNSYKFFFILYRRVVDKILIYLITKLTYSEIK